VTGKGIVLHDHFAFLGGAERLVVLLAKGLGPLDLATGYVVPSDPVRSNLQGLSVRDLGAFSAVPLWRMFRLERAFRAKTGFLSQYDRVVYSGSVAPLAVHNHRAGVNILYCHSIPRFAYDLKEEYLRRLPPWQRPVMSLLAAYTREVYGKAVRSMDRIVVNSRNVRERLRRYLGLDSEIVYPPCETSLFRWLGQEEYYLSTARMEKEKRVDRIVRAFTRMTDRKLVVASGGPEEKRLKRLAEGYGNIRFTGWLKDDELIKLMGRAVATIYIPLDEDFGMSPLESMAAGKPVIGVAEGGLLETVIHGKTGLLLPEDPSEDHIVEAVLRMTPRKAAAMRRECEHRAREFDTTLFLRNMKDVLGRTGPGVRPGDISVKNKECP